MRSCRSGSRWCSVTAATASSRCASCGSAAGCPVRGARVVEFSLGVMARSRKESERRLAIHPLHIERIEADLLRRIYLEHGYGEPFGVPDERLAGYVGGLRTRDQLLAGCDVILLPKPLPQDLA